MKAATIILMTIGVFFLVQEAQAVMSAEQYWTTKISGNPSITTDVTKDKLLTAFEADNFQSKTGETALSAADRVDLADGTEDDNCKYPAFLKLASDPKDTIYKFLQEVN